ncbi:MULTISPECIES: TonB-dependent receptor [unclassified Duganella]|uniref:TonB-dependent siderophore receptor n=1 Tax=unclassified Duganella TaxID=2636909 RepID=UPI0008836844|nr:MULTISPECIES: TonB-dependent receptor [unclassified Duganella]SDF61776.1 outer-membrane receptor for ferric coprogen and ferric-rhodotorulic acid [Duganella sp. OV458]SDI66695.1 outer-membrane receptor for ferric coprogen and ferric-rhodotorulic acid [Duganella sp. OV510]
MQHNFQRRPIACAISLMLCLGALPPAHAQTAPASKAQGQEFNIAAGPLGPALRSFAMTTGISIIFTADQTDRKSTAGLRGAYSVQDGFTALLNGTGMEAARVETGGYVLRAQRVVPPQAVQPAPAPAPRPQPAAEAALPAITINGARQNATEGTGSYTARATNTATRMDLSLRETPQSVSVLTRQQIEDQGLVTLDDAVKSITGLVMQKGYFVGNSGSFSARGFEVTNMLLDGLPTTMGANGTFNADNADLVVYDRIEVVRGANGLTSGSGNPSAAINLVRKRPTAEQQVSLTASAGSWNDYQLQLDASNALNEAKTLRGRVVIAAQDKDFFYDVSHERTQQAYGILEADLARGTTLTVGAHYRDMKNTGGYQGFPTHDDGSQLDLPRSSTLNNAYDFWNQTDKTVFAELDQRLGGGWKAKLSAIKKWQYVDMMFTSIRGDDAGFSNNSQAYRLDNEQNSFDATIGGPFALLGRKHEVSLGLSHRKAVNDNYGDWGIRTTAIPFDPFHFDPYAASRPAANYQRWGIGSTLKESGVYGSARFSITDPLSLIVGARSSWYDYNNDRSDAGYKVTREITPYAGAVCDLDANHSLYASWTEIFQPQSTVDASGNLLKPVTGTNYEAGVKGEYFGGALNASLAVFQVSQENRAMSDRDGPSPCPSTGSTFCSRAAGKVESKGVEMEVSGELTPGWQMTAGYTYVSAKFVTDSNAANIGKLFDPDLPRHQFKLSTSYRLPGELQRWRVGGSVNTQNAIYSSDDDRITHGGYSVVGLHAAYQFNEKLGLRLNVNNLFDKVYYQGIGWTTGGNTYGTPRNATLTLNYKL